MFQINRKAGMMIELEFCEIFVEISGFNSETPEVELCWKHL